jgi:GNAT superfamily N-acetyltransferase
VAPPGLRVRPARAADADALARLWHQGWHDAHAAFAPPALVAARTPADFRRRIAAAIPTSLVAEADGVPLGLATLCDDELNQFYVAAEGRGQGVAGALMAAALAALAAAGWRAAWLACAVGNARAARFYDKAGWTRSGPVSMTVESDAGPVAMPVWRYAIAVPAPALSGA